MTGGENLARRYWIGGGSGGGKSTIARALAARHSLTLYDTDQKMSDHAGRTTAADSPYLHAFMAMDMDDRWATRDVATMLDTFHWYRGEAFDLIIDDVGKIPQDTVVEGFRLLPRLLAPRMSERDRAVWLLPTPEFRRHAFTIRGSLYAIASRTSNPERALTNLLERDALFTERLQEETERLGLPSIVVDGSRTLDELLSDVETILEV